MITALRWLLFVGFLAQIAGIVCGVLLLARIKREQKAMVAVLETFSDRSAQIAQAIATLTHGRGKD